ncbi:MAG TPA: RnfH family protein [Burkholderiales bacterium]|nr:RnfH family protein [Burkholderiales bacterium]
MRVEVVIAYPDRAQARSLNLPAGATVRDALAASGYELSLEGHACGIFGKRVTLDRKLAEGDRVEIYRPLALDPKEARRRRALSTKKRR